MPEPDAQFFLQFLYSIGAIVWIALGAKQLFFKKDLPQPMSVQIEEELEDRFATKAEHAALKESHEELKRNVETRLKAMSDSAVRGREKIYAKLEKIAEETAEQRSSLKSMTATLDRQERKLDNLSSTKADK